MGERDDVDELAEWLLANQPVLGHCALCAADVPTGELDDAARCRPCQRESEKLEQRRRFLLSERPVKPVPDDPFADLPRPERATCDKDHLPCR